MTPKRYTIQTGEVNLPGAVIPVRLTTAKSTVRILEPANPNELKDAASDWVQSEHHEGHPEFRPKMKLVAREIEIMWFNPSEILSATVEAVLRSWPGQGSWHVSHWQQRSSTARVTLVGDDWGA